MKQQYKALIQDTILKELRSKTLLFIFIATTASIILSHLAIKLVNTDMNQNGGLSLIGINVLTITLKIINVTSFFTAIIFGISSIRSDFYNNIIHQYLSFPITRLEYFSMRMIGTWIIVIGYYLYSYLLSTILYSISFNKFIFTGMHLLAMLVSALSLFMVIGISAFFSLKFNKIGALFSSLGFTLIGSISYLNFSKYETSQYFTDFGLFKLIGFIFYFLTPRIAFLDEVSSSLMSGVEMNFNYSFELIHLGVMSFLYYYLIIYFLKRIKF